MHTHIYIAISSRNPRISDRAFGYLITAEGREYSVEDYSILYSSWQRAYLYAINEALSRFNTSVPCEITIHVPDKGTVNQFNKTLPDSWQMCGWMNRRGQEIKNRDQWQKLYNQTYMARAWKVDMVYENHEYMEYMKYKMETADERAV